MAFDSLRKPAAKPSPSHESEERRKQLSGSTPTTKSPDSTVPRYLRAQLGMASPTEQRTQEEPRSGIPLYLRGELDRTTAPAPKPSAPPTAASPADLGKSEPLAPKAASRFSKAYGQDLSGVRVHPDSPLPGAVGARAVAVGNDIAFARDAYQPGSSEGQQLIGHELAHVVQQSKGQKGLQAEGLSTDGYERQADEAARSALAGEPVAELSPLATPTVQHKAADAPSPAAPAGREKPRAGRVPEGVLDLSKGLLDPAHIAPDAHGRVLARLPGLAEGELELEKRGEGYSTRGEGYALPLSVGPLAGVLGDSLVLAVRIDNNVISGRAAVGKPGRSVPKGDPALFRAIEKNPEAMGWAGFSKLTVGTLRNALEDGTLKLGADSARFTLGGFVEGTGSFSVAGERVTFSGTAEVKLPGASTGRLEVSYSPETGLSGETSLKVGVGKVSGGVDARLRQGVLDIQGTAGYGGDRLKGSVTLVATDAATAQEITRKPPQAGMLPGQEGAAGAGAGAGAGPGAAVAPAAKPGPRALCGWGELDFSLTEWLTGRVMVVVNSQGEATVQGEIAPPKEIILFEQKEWTKSLVKVEARALYGLPVVGNVFVFANVGLEALASIGPGKLYNIRMSGQYSTDKQVDKELNLQASLNIPAYAGLRLRAEGGAGVELADHDIKFGVGVSALAGVRGYVEATPTIGYRQKAGAPGEFYFKGHMELAAQPFLGLGGDLFVEVDSPFWSPLPDEKWTWPLGSMEYPLPGEFGLGADVEHVLGSKQWPEIQLTEVEFDSSSFMMDLLSGGAPGKGKGGEDKKPAAWNDGGAGGAGAGGKGGGAKGGPATKGAAAAPAKAPAGGGKKGKGASAKPGKAGVTPAGGKPAKEGKGPTGKGKEPGKTSDKLELPLSMAGASHTLIITTGQGARVEMASRRDLLSNKIGRAVGRLLKRRKDLEASGQHTVLEKLDEQIRDLKQIGAEARNVQKEAERLRVNPRKDLSGYAAGQEVTRFKALRGLIDTYGEYHREKDIEGYLDESVSEPPIYKLVGKQIVKRGSGDEADKKLVEHIEGYKLPLVDKRVHISRKEAANKATPEVHLDEAGVLKLGAKNPEKEEDPEERLEDYRQLATMFAEKLHVPAPEEPKWSSPPKKSELRSYREAIRDAVVEKYKNSKLSVFDKEVLSSAIIPPKHNKMRGVIFELWVIRSGKGVLGDPKPYFAKSDDLDLLAEKRRHPDGWIINAGFITLVDMKAMQVTSRKDGTPTANGPDDDALNQASDYELITSLATPWEHVTPDGKVIKLPCTKVRYYFNHQIVADIWFPELTERINLSRLETEPKARTKPKD
jgi:hypothetical protein